MCCVTCHKNKRLSSEDNLPVIKCPVVHYRNCCFYYCFYSGGRWETENYGVDYGVADSVMGPYSDAGNENGPRVLRSHPGYVLGPGHNSIVLGPNGQTEYIVYHAWATNMAMRQMWIDQLIWTPDGPRCNGPSWTPQAIVN